MNNTTRTRPKPKTLPVISSGRLKCVGGEKGSPGCERKYMAQYPFNLKQKSSDALEFGSQLHAVAEIYQSTGEIPDPESRVAEVFRAGAHNVVANGPLLVEYCHEGLLPDGTPYVAYIDGHEEFGNPYGGLIIQDLKTTSAPAWALHDGSPSAKGKQRPSNMHIKEDLQALFYAWVLTCSKPHLFAPQLPQGHFGPMHWKVWDADERNAKVAKLRWVYFRTKGNPLSWNVEHSMIRVELERIYLNTIQPLIDKILDLHLLHERQPDARVEDLKLIARNSTACKHIGRWCGLGDLEQCEIMKAGTPVDKLLEGKGTTNMSEPTTPEERRARLKARVAAAKAKAKEAPAETTKEAPETTEPVPVEEESEAKTAKKKRRGRPKKRDVAPPAETPAVSAGEVGVNPPESTKALSELAKTPAPELAVVDQMTQLRAAIGSLESLGFQVTLTTKRNV